MKKHTLILLYSILFITVLPLSSYAQSKVPNNRKRPTVGLVLSGGGAKGFAYIGLLKVIQKAGLPIDYIGGTSIGSIVGALYAMGYSPETMLKMVRSQNWDDLMQDKPQRKYLAYEEKEYAENDIVNLLLKGKHIKLKSSLIEGQEINLLLNHYFNGAYRTTDFSKLQTPFLCVGTDILNGHAEILKHGNLAMAVRSSMSIPIYFSPTLYNGRYLVDGGLINNFPVNAVKKMGAQIIIGVDVQAGLADSIKQLNTIPKVMEQISAFYRQDANKKAYQNTNHYIHIKMKYNLMDFNDFDSIISIGKHIGEEHFLELKQLADSLNRIKYKPLKKFQTTPLDSVYVDDITIVGTSRVPLKYVIGYFKRFKDSWVHIDQLEHTIRLLYGTRYFEHVFYELHPMGNKTQLLIKIKEASPGILGAALHYDSDYQGSLLLNLALRNSIGHGTKFFVKAVIGPNPRLQALHLVDRGGNIGYGSLLDIYSFHFNQYNGDAKETAYKFINFSAAAFMRATLHNNYDFRLGFEFERFKFNRVYLVESIPEAVYNYASYGNLFFSFGADTYDKPYFPTKGFKTDLKFKYVMPFSKGFSQNLFQNTSVAYINYVYNQSLSNRFVLQTGFFGGVTFGHSYSQVQGLFFLGGLNPSNYSKSFIPFTGLHFIQKAGYNVWVVRAKLRYTILKKVYATLRTDIGAMENSLPDVFVINNTMFGYGLTLSYNSFIGPVEVTLMSSNRHATAGVYFSLGHWF